MRLVFEPNCEFKYVSWDTTGSFIIIYPPNQINEAIFQRFKCIVRSNFGDVTRQVISPMINNYYIIIIESPSKPNQNMSSFISLQLRILIITHLNTIRTTVGLWTTHNLPVLCKRHTLSAHTSPHTHHNNTSSIYPPAHDFPPLTRALPSSYLAQHNHPSSETDTLPS